jgi:hypothetical protein
MRKKLFLFFVFTSTTCLSQSKLVPVTSSTMTGIELPAGTRQDTRILATVAAQTLLEMTAKDNNITLEEKVEVFSLPAGTNDEQVKLSIGKAGYATEILTDKRYALIKAKKGNYLLYLDVTKRETILYISPTISLEPVIYNPPAESGLGTKPSQPEIPLPPIETKPENIPSPPTPTTTFKDSYTFTTTNFDDGWIATVEADFVKVVKADTKVYLHYADDFTPYNGKIEPENHYWNTLISQRYTTHNASRWVEMSYPPIHFIEGDATEKLSGKRCYLAMNVRFNNGGATVILIVTPSKTVYQQQFTHPNDTEKMLGYNKFAISATDLTGDWAETSGAHVNLYNVYTGGHAGSNYASSADSFAFSANGTYSSKHSGASSTYGNNSYYSQEYKGKATATNWDLTLTNRWKDETTVFHAQFEAVRGGRVLHLQDKKYSAMQYHLVKIKK